jgi:hypothetical protein
LAQWSTTVVLRSGFGKRTRCTDVRNGDNDTSLPKRIKPV